MTFENDIELIEALYLLHVAVTKNDVKQIKKQYLQLEQKEDINNNTNLKYDIKTIKRIILKNLRM